MSHLTNRMASVVNQTIRTFGTVHFISFGTAGGVGMAYAVQKEKYWQLPLALVFPYLYGGYHLYKNKDRVVQWFHMCSRKSIP
jgi:hypothetical protein